MKTICPEGRMISEKRQWSDHWMECVTSTSDWLKLRKIMHDPKLIILVMSEANVKATRCDFLERNREGFDVLGIAVRSGEWIVLYQAR